MGKELCPHCGAAGGELHGEIVEMPKGVQFVARGSQHAEHGSASTEETGVDPLQ